MNDAELLQVCFGQVVLALILGVILGRGRPRLRHRAEALGRRLHQADQDGDRPAGLLRRCARHLGHGRPQEGGPGRVKAVLYFEVLTTFALMIGVVLAYVFQPGVGMNIDPASLDASAMAAYTDRSARCRAARSPSS